MIHKRFTLWLACLCLVHSANGEEIGEIPDKPAPDTQAFLGVATAAMPAILSDHLALEPDGGVVVETVGNNSPAQQAGIQVHDVITKVAGKPIQSPLDLGREIRTHKPGNTIRIHRIHQGKSDTLDVVLAQREEMPIPREMEEDQDAPGIEQLRDHLLNLKQRLKGIQLPKAAAQQAPAPAPMGGVRIQGGGELRLADPNGTIGFKSDQNGTEITVRDNNNQIIWTGPWDTPQDKASAPDSIRARIEQFNILPTHDGNGLQLQMGNHPPEQIPDDGMEDEENP